MQPTARLLPRALKTHYRDAQTLIDAGWRVLMEKPLTHSLATAREFAAYLDADDFRRTALMQAFMRRFDAPLLRAKALLDQGAIGAPFKIVSILEDPVPPPEGYNSSGILSDMARYTISTRSSGSAGSSPSGWRVLAVCSTTSSTRTSKRISTMPSCRCTFPTT